MRKKISHHKTKRQHIESDSLNHANLYTSESDNPVIDLQRTIGNYATQQQIQSKDHLAVNKTSFAGLVMRIPQISTSNTNSGQIQRASVEELESQLQKAQQQIKPKKKGSKAWKTLNNRIERLKGEIQTLKTAPPEPEPEPEPEKPAEPFKEKYPKLADSFEESAIEELEGTIGEARLASLLELFGGNTVKHIIDTLTLTKFADLVSLLDNSALQIIQKNFSLEKLKDLFSVYTMTQINTILNSYGLKETVDIFNNFTAEDFSKFEQVVTRTRVKYLIKTKNLNGEALAHYAQVSPTFLRDFKGAGSSTMKHLLDIYIKGDGSIGGGHDADVFYPFIDEVIGSYEDDEGETIEVTRGKDTYTNQGSLYDKVSYTTYDRDGYRWNSGSKTLVHNLQSNQTLWLKRANEAIWASIRA